MDSFLYQFALPDDIVELYLLSNIQKSYLTYLLIFVQALTVPLNDGGFLILLHSSHFLTYDGKI